jgi:O-antigen/teichoic acid export membrane protein
VAFSIGLMITVLYHHILLDFDFRRMFFDRVSLEDFKVDFNLVFFYNLNFSITQIYGRSLGFIVNYYLSASTAGLFLYARSASNAVSQILLFSRRVEFDNEVYSINFRSLLKFQKLSVALSIAAFSGALFLTLVLNYYGDEDFYLISLYLLLTLFSLIVWNFSNSLSMILVKFELVDKVAFISLITISIQIGFLLIFTPIYGIYTLFVSEVVLFLVQGLLFLFVAKKNFKKREVSIHG